MVLRVSHIKKNVETHAFDFWAY